MKLHRSGGEFFSEHGNPFRLLGIIGHCMSFGYYA
jgi:hypothetical protein